MTEERGEKLPKRFSRLKTRVKTCETLKSKNCYKYGTEL
jgi:hypothetical protein